MSFTKDNIVTALNSRLGRSETSTTIAEIIKAGLKFVSEGGLWPCLWNSKEDYTIESGTSYLDWPTDFRVLDEIRINDGTYDGDPLDEITYEEWLQNREDETSANYDEPVKFAQRGKRFYLDPVSDDDYTGKVYFWRYHPDQAEIIFDDSFKEAVFNAVMGKYFESKGPAFADAATYYLNISLREMSRLPQDTKVSQVKYHDL
jgi:hypothetical protein